MSAEQKRIRELQMELLGLDVFAWVQLLPRRETS